MIRSFSQKGLKRLYARGISSGLPPEHVGKLRRILAALDAARVPSDLNLPGYRLHPLKGRLGGYWSVTVSPNWRVTFRVEAEEVHNVDLVDYH